MRKQIEKVRKWIGVQGVEDWKVERITFLWTISQSGDTLKVKAAGSEWTLTLKKNEAGVPVQYESEPIGTDAAKKLCSFYDVIDSMTATFVINGSFQPCIQIYGLEGEPHGQCPVEIDKVRLVK